MIPQSFKDILSSGEHIGLYQTIAMIIFILLFLAIAWFVFSRPKKYYQEEENAPLSNDEDINTTQDTPIL